MNAFDAARVLSAADGTFHDGVQAAVGITTPRGDAEDVHFDLILDKDDDAETRFRVVVKRST